MAFTLITSFLVFLSKRCLDVDLSVDWNKYPIQMMYFLRARVMQVKYVNIHTHNEGK